MTLTKKHWSIIAAAVGITIGAAVVLYLVLSRDRRPISYTEDVKGLVGADVRIQRNVNGIPLITAASYHDAYYALGFIHAQDRFRQMEYYRAIANGYSRRVIGRNGSIMNRLSAIIGFTRMARAMAARIPEPYTGYLASYAAGVNRGRAAARYENIIGRDWTPEDVLTVLAMKEWANSFLNNKENLFQLPVGKKSVRLLDLFPVDMLSYYADNEEQCVTVVRRLKQLVREHLGTFDRGYAFAVPARVMQDQPPFLAYTMDDELSLYPGWYPVHIEIGGKRLRGVTYAGMPFFFTASNGTVTYASFNLDMDVQDFIFEQIRRTRDGILYLTADGWREFTSERVPLTLSGGKVKNYLVWSSSHGPILNDVFPGEEYGAGVVTLKSYNPGEEYVLSLFNLPQAESLVQAEGCLKGIRSYPRAWVIVAEADAVCRYTGLVPQRDRDDQVFRSSLKEPWKGLTDLSRAAQHPWGGSFLDDEALGDQRPYLIADLERQQRLMYLLNGGTRVSEQDVENILHDRYSMPAERFMPIIMDLLKDNPVTSSRLTRIFFQNWKKEMNADEVAPLLYQLLLQRFLLETVGDELGNSTPDVMAHYQYLIPKFYELVLANKSDLFDDQSTYQRENRSVIFDRAFLKTMRIYSREAGPYMEKWHWGAAHRGRFALPLRRAGIFARDPEDVPYHGSFSTLLKGSFNLNLKPVEISSMSGYFGRETAILYLRFAQSITRRSPFYYGSGQGTTIVSFQDIYTGYTMHIRPESAARPVPAH